MVTGKQLIQGRTDHFSKRSPLLDCIRAVAIFGVLVFHVATRYAPESLDPVAYAFWRYGFLGVDMFFPLSGFLITRFLLRAEQPRHIRAFFLRRIFRIMPLYYAAVLVYVAASLVTGVDRELLGDIWAPLTFTTGWFIFFNGAEAVPYQITWSLSVEEFAYVLFGLAAWISRKNFVAFLLVCTLVPIALRVWLNLQGADEIYFLPLARIDAIAMGGLLAWGITRKLPVIAILAGLAVALQLGFAVGPALVKQTLFVSFVATLTCLAIAIFEGPMANWRPRWLRPFALLGFYSYFIYLIHFFVIYGIFEAASFAGLDVSFWVMVMASLLLTYIAAALSWRFFEQPMIDFGRRLEREADSRSFPQG